MSEALKYDRELNGAEAQEFARLHLNLIRVDVESWITEYVCPETGGRWIEDYPHSEMHGGGPPRLRRVARDTGGA
ncbi:MAG: hypothetical protein GXY33_16025 [Phycisphaerae bacterium]|nr:hypothetical protein [Phycisphaerae bacterium]